jgi:hypothetical protein
MCKSHEYQICGRDESLISLEKRHLIQQPVEDGFYIIAAAFPISFFRKRQIFEPVLKKRIVLKVLAS